MKKNILAVCDLEAEYALSFMNYMNGRKNLPFEIQAFTGVEAFMKFARENTIEVLLIADTAMCSRIEELDIGKVILLSEGGYYPEFEEYPNIYKYQSSESVIREVMSCYGLEENDSGTLSVSKKMMELIGVYSPLGRCGKTSFSLTMGQILSRNHSVLYLNMEDHAGFQELLERKYEHTISDVLYYVHQKHKNISYKISGIVETLGNMDYLPPAESAEDLRMVTEEEWRILLDTLMFQSAYEITILDLGDGIDGLFSILNRCHKVYVPVLSDRISQCKINQLERLLKKRELEHLWNKMEKLILPVPGVSGDGKNYLEQLVWGELGDFTKNLIRKEKACGDRSFVY